MKREKEKTQNATANIIDFPVDSNIKKTNNDLDIKQIAIECLKKSNISGKPEEIANEYLKIYNILKTNVRNDNIKKQEIPEQTVFDDYIICLEDGKKMQMLNRHLKVYYNMTFQEYKKKWGLPIDYPNVCKNYSKVRSKIAKNRKK